MHPSVSSAVALRERGACGLVLSNGARPVDTAAVAHGVVWAAAGHAHAGCPTTYDELLRLPAGTPAQVAG